MGKTNSGKKKVYVHEYSYEKNGKVITVPAHYRSTPN